MNNSRTLIIDFPSAVYLELNLLKEIVECTDVPKISCDLRKEIRTARFSLETDFFNLQIKIIFIL